MNLAGLRNIGNQILVQFRRQGIALLALTVFVGAPTSALKAQEWAAKMFSTLEHDFGTVARGADSVYRFEITNLYKQDMSIVGVKSSCGCTSPSIENPIIKTHEKAYIVAKFNTRDNVGQKGATVTVNFGAPYAAEVQLRVRGRIRGDVVFDTGSVDFGEVDEGLPHERKVKVSYAGRSDWQIVDVTNDNDAFEVELAEVKRQGSRVDYDLLIRLKEDVSAGHVKDQLTVVTNDRSADSQRIPLFVSARIRPEFTVAPPMLVLEKVAPGAVVNKKIVVTGRSPFRVARVDCEQESLAFKADNDDLKKVHFVDVQFTASLEPGEVRAPVQIITDRGPNRCAECTVLAAVVAPEPKAAEIPSDSAAATDEPSQEKQTLSKAS